nr:hypothetical protein [Oxalobacteraceae bacterium]
SFTSTTPNGAFKAGDQINITAIASEALAAGSTITVKLSLDHLYEGVDGRLVVLSVDESDATNLVGTFDVLEGDMSGGLTIDSFVLGLTEGDNAPFDLAGNVMTSTSITSSMNLADSKVLLIDTTAPAAPALSTEGTTDQQPVKINGGDAQSKTFRVNLKATGLLAMAGDQVELVLDEEDFPLVKTGILGSDQIEAGYFDLTVTKNDLGPDGSKLLTARLVDAAGNLGILSAPLNLVLDATPPAIESFTSTTPNGAFKAGDQIDITAIASEALAAGSTITVTLETGAVDRQVVLTRDDFEATKLVGSYIVEVGDTADDLTIASFFLGGIAGGSVPEDEAGNLMTSTTITSNLDLADPPIVLVIDTTSPAAPALTERDTAKLTDGLLNAKEAAST